MGHLGRAVVYFDGSDSDKVRRRLARKCMAMKHPAPSAGTGHARTQQSGSANNYGSTIEFC